VKGYCKDCKSITEGQSRGATHFCKECGKFTPKNERPQNAKIKDNGYSAEYVVSSEKRITKVEQLWTLIQFDKKEWQIDKWEQVAGVSEGYRKDKKGWWQAEDGKISGHTEDSGKMLVVPLHSFKIRVWLSRKTEEIRNNLLVDDLITKAKKHAPKYRKIRYQKGKASHLFELGLPDLQLGRLVAAEDAGQDLNPEMQIEKADAVVDKLIGYADAFNVSRVLFPVGNDFFDTNTAEMTTAHGTPQQDDVRWKRTYRLGCEFIVRTTEKLMQIAPVDILVIPGNHDEDKIFHLGEYVSAWHHKNPNVVVDNRPMKRKYYSFGANLIGLTHGYFEKNAKLDSLMAYEVPQLWAKSQFREWHLGDKHHKVDMVLKTNELENGVVVRILRSLATPSVWEFDKGLVGSLKAAEAFVWNEHNGLVAQFTAAG
jgi:hypothetical protein